jgi:hypothetical protein
MVVHVGLGPWWTVATDGWRTSPALSVQLPQATGAHRGEGKGGGEDLMWVLTEVEIGRRDDG